MRIKRLEVIGFKSFCDRTIVNFNEPITGVVGPNGCGKSNIVDAIRWCMGEQSAKHLRGKAMDDVIFAGSDSRGPLGMCEVTLVFENDGRVPLEYLAYAEIAVTRKLYRDGTSEYFLNKTPCRLRDITEFFMGTGIGAKAYSIIEQGRVGMIVSSKPEDRRFLIEEAAGITKYKVKKKAAEKKMEATRLNLLRVSDVVAEIEKQLGSLRRQAQKAERYREYKGELRELELRSGSHRWLGLLCEERVVCESLDRVTGEREIAQTGLATSEAEIEHERLVATEEEGRLGELQEGLYQVDNRIRLGEAENDHGAREVSSLEERGVEARAEIEVLERQAQEDALEHDRLEGERVRLDAAMSDKGAVVGAREAVWREHKAEQSVLQQAMEAARGEVAAHQAEIVRAEGNERAADRRRQDLEVRVERLAEEGARLEQRGETLRETLAEQGRDLGGLRQLGLDLVVERERSETRAAELDLALAALRPELEEVLSELHKRRSRRASLEEIAARYEGFARGPRSVMQQRESRWGICGLIADVVHAPPELEAAVEAVLAERLGAVLVESQEVGVELIEHLKTTEEGRASFIPLNRFAEAPAAVTEGILGTEGVRGRLLDLVRLDEACAPIAGYLLGDVYVAEDLLTALDLWRGGLRVTLVTPEGEVVDRHGVVSGGSGAAEAGVLQQKREIRELEELIATLEARHNELSVRELQAKQELQALTRALETLRHDAHQGEMRLLTLEKDQERDRQEMERLSARLQVLGNEREELAAQAGEAARETEEARLGVRAARDRLLSAEDRVTSLGHQAVELLARLEGAQEAVTAIKVEVAQAEEKRSAVAQALVHVEEGRAERGARRERLQESIAQGTARVELLRGAIAERETELFRLVDERTRAAEELTVGRAAYEERRGRLLQREAAVKTVRAEVEALSSEATRLELRQHDLKSARAHLEESIVERYRVALPSQIHDHHLKPPVGEAEERRAKELRDLIDRMGEINLNAIEEYNELEARYTFLTGQRTDLESALGQLEEAIDRINKTSRQRFREVFDLVNQKFQEIFPRCFKGGQGRLVLTDEENLLDSGIEIIAQPPGKKNATVEVLSGGEKAMTAVALIFSIFLIKPSPFCLLDEVDAPLDEANVGRFNDLVREMTDRSQFIIITHNKRTMQIVDSLYGVTMEEPGISKLVSVNLSALGKDAPGQRPRRVAAA